MHSTKQAVIIIYIMKKNLFVAASFEGLWVVPFHNKETSSIFWSTGVFFVFLKKKGISIFKINTFL